MTAGRQLEHGEARPDRRTFPLHVLAHDLERADNVGGLFRLADALGVTTLYLTGRTPRPPHPRIRKLARATERVVAYQGAFDAASILDALRARGVHLAALEVTDASVDVRHLGAVRAPEICLVLGAERGGISADLLDRCDAAYHVPMFGQNSSMNVVTAAAIAVYEAGRRFWPAATGVAP